MIVIQEPEPEPEPESEAVAPVEQSVDISPHRLRGMSTIMGEWRLPPFLLPFHCLSTAFPCLSTAFPRPFLAFPRPFHGLSLPFHCLSTDLSSDLFSDLLLPSGEWRRAARTARPVREPPCMPSTTKEMACS